MNKVTLPKEVAEELEYALEHERSNSILFAEVIAGVYEKLHAHFEYDTDSLMSALVNGYEVEQTPEEKVREYYEGYKRMEAWRGHDGHDARGAVDIIETTLDLLGIKISGVNAE
jgi:hypothetical protein